MISIGNLWASPGQKVSGSIPILSTTITPASTLNSTFTNTSIPITILNGIQNGPTLLLLAGIHGSEYTPIRTTQRLARDLNPSLVHGSILLVHIANLPSYLGRTIYTSPVDRLNLNRVFPGRSDGSITERIANVLVEEVYPLVDYVVDMHSGDGNEQLSPSYVAYYGKAGRNDVRDKSKKMAFGFGLDLIVEFQWELNDNHSAKNSSSTVNNAIWAGSAAVVRNIPSIDVELAPGMGKSPLDTIEEAYNCVLRLMVHLNMLQSPLPDDVLNRHDRDSSSKEHVPCIVKKRHFIEAPSTGTWIPLVNTGTYITKGTSIGYITDYFGRTKLYEAIAPSDGLLLIRFESPPVLVGDTVAVVAVLNDTDNGCARFMQGGVGGLSNDTRGDYKNGVVDNGNLVVWQWIAMIGWLITLTLGIFLGRMRRRLRSNMYQYSDESAIIEDDAVMKDAPRRII